MSQLRRKTPTTEEIRTPAAAGDVSVDGFPFIINDSAFL
jgi:hypothetical protein